MKKVLFFVLTVFLFTSCSNKEDENTMYVKGTIQGLKKGTLYLQKQMDTLIVSVDSVFVDGTDTFLLKDIITSPEMYYLTLGDTNKKISFFGEKDTITIHSKLNNFAVKSKIAGSENQDLLEKYYDIKSKFSNQNLDLIKAEFDAKKSGNNDSIVLIQRQLKSLTKRQYLFSVNYAINNADYEVAPYIALTELNNVVLNLLDTINNALTPEVKQSKYGVKLDAFVLKIRENEK